MYKKVDAKLDFVSREREVLEFWRENKIFEKTLEQTKNGKEFSFYDGPPTANGKPHIGHILTRVMKDIIPRYKTMKGYHVRRQAGWDTHGLPVELEIEKILGMDGKQDIEKYGVEPFTKKCRESVWKYKSDWEQISEAVGYWVDMDAPYITYEDNYIESVWWSLKKISDMGLIYKGHKIVPYCPRCGTALSSHEVAQGYKDVKEKSIVVCFNILSDKYPNTSFLAWTTTPWTLPSNVALCVNPKEDYSLIESEGKRYILADALIKNHFEKFKVLKKLKGRALEKIPYEPLFDFAKDDIEKGKAYYVTCNEFVTLTDGTGIVHIAPAFGEDDARVGKDYDLPFVQLVNDRGQFVEGAKGFSGKFCKDADKEIILNLKARGLLFSEMMYEHSYPYCWRCDTPLLYYARATWFIAMSKVRDRLLENNAKITWFPDTIGKGRFGNFLENVIDWGLSRERYWGTPLPIWVCKTCKTTRTIGSKAELKEASNLTGDIELHKPYVDDVVIKCACGGEMHRTPEVIDCWYDSGSMPFAQMHYPFENKELFEKTFPADFISEAVDQTRGWFYTLLAISTLLFDTNPFKNCLVLGHVCDKNGEKMSKHKGNGIDPKDVLDEQGADAVRWYFYTGSSPWLPSRFFKEAVSESQRKFLGTLWNVYSFFVLYAEIDAFDPKKYRLEDCTLTLMDKWILSELNSLIREIDEGLENYRITESGRKLQEFTDFLSNWYVRRSRERFWGSGMDEDKKSAYCTLYTVLKTLCQLSAPFVPFITESIWQNIVSGLDENAPKSVHLSEFPRCENARVDMVLNQDMQTIINIAQAGRAVRNAHNLKNRQPLKRMYVVLPMQGISKELLAVAAEEINVLEAEVVTDASGFIKYDLKPQLKTLGPKYGKNLGVLREELGSKAQEILSAVRDGGVYKGSVGEFSYELNESDLLISVTSKEGYNSETVNGVTVILDTALDENLIELGTLREIISKLQTMRKDSDFVVTDRIKVYYSTSSESIAKIFDKFAEDIKRAVLADSIFMKKIDNSKEWDINGSAVHLFVAR